MSNVTSRFDSAPREFRLVVKGDVAYIQQESDLQKAIGGKVETLVVDFSSVKGGTCAVTSEDPITSNYLPIFGVYGLATVESVPHLVVITAVEKVAVCVQSIAYKILSTKVLSPQKPPRLPAAQAAVVDLARQAFDAANAGGFGAQYVSYTYDLTKSCQEQPQMLSGTPSAVQVSTSDKRFMWNASVAQPLIAAGAKHFVVPCVQGFIETIAIQLPASVGPPPVEAPATRSTRYALDADNLTCPSVLATVTVLARRATPRAGTRHWRRGADKSGHVANFVESEQITAVYPETGEKMLPPPSHVAAFVQVRGSIPLVWAQIPSLKYKPRTDMAPEQVSSNAFRKHANDMLGRYHRVTAVNLANHHGSEGALTAAFKREAKRFADSPPSGAGPFRLVSFDFHQECGTSRYWNLAKLYVQLEADLHGMGVFRQTTPSAQPTMPVSRQTGVIRTNCIDCLDRTNVVQALLARRQLEAFMGDLLLPGGAVLVDFARRIPSLDKQLRYLWADHGDAVSMHYAGTGALKSGFTRTGKRTLMGLADDGWKSAVRYYKNNFVDGERQDMVDLGVGGALVNGQSPGGGAQPVYGESRSPALLVAVALALLLYGAFNGMLVGVLMVTAITSTVLQVLGYAGPQSTAQVIPNESDVAGEADTLAEDSMEGEESEEARAAVDEVEQEAIAAGADIEVVEDIAADDVMGNNTVEGSAEEDEDASEMLNSTTTGAAAVEDSSVSDDGAAGGVGGLDEVRGKIASFIQSAWGRFQGTWSPTAHPPLPASAESDDNAADTATEGASEEVTDATEGLTDQDSEASAELGSQAAGSEAFHEDEQAVAEDETEVASDQEGGQPEESSEAMEDTLADVAETTTAGENKPSMASDIGSLVQQYVGRLLSIFTKQSSGTIAPAEESVTEEGNVGEEAESSETSADQDANITDEQEEEELSEESDLAAIAEEQDKGDTNVEAEVDAGVSEVPHEVIQQQAEVEVAEAMASEGMNAASFIGETLRGLRMAQVPSLAAGAANMWQPEVSISFVGPHVILPQFLAMLCLYQLVKGGKKYVNAPRLCPDQVKQW